MSSSRRPVSLWQRFLLDLETGIPGYVRSPWFALNALVEVRGPLDLLLLDRALDDLVRRHEVLRTQVDSSREPVQVVSDRVNTHIEVVTGDGGTADTDWLYAPVPGDGPPPFRIRVVRRAPDVHLVGLHMHHLVTDPTTLWETLRELTQLYSAQLGAPEPPPPSAQYGEYAEAEARQVRDAGPEHRQWWAETLGGLRLASGGPAPAGASTPQHLAPAVDADPESLIVERLEIVGADGLDRIERWSRIHRSTVFATVLALLAHRMKTLSDAPSDLLFFTLFARRDRPAWQRMLGPCTVPAYVALRRPPVNFTPEFVSSVRDCLRASQIHSRLPLGAVESEVPRLFDRVGTSGGPDVPFVVYLPREWPARLAFGPAVGRVVQASGPRPSQHEPHLGIRVRKAGGGTLAARVSYHPARWSRDNVHRLLRAVPDGASLLPGAP